MYWLAFDVGTSGTKAALIDENGQLVVTAFRPYNTHSAPGGVMEQNANDWWRAVVDCTREISAQVGAQSIQAIALTGQMQDVILVNGEGIPQHPVILYSDLRARSEAEEVNKRIGDETLYSLTGNHQDAGGLLAKLLWLARNQPAVLRTKGIRLLLGAADFIAYHMTGKFVADTTTASTTGLMNINTRQPLPKEVFAALSIPNAAEMLPNFTAGGTHIGNLNSHAAKTLGLKVGMPVYHGPGDAGATTLGAGAGAFGQVYAYLGTSGWIAFSAPQRATGDGVITLAHPNPNHFIQVAPLLTAGGNLEWVRDLFGAEDYPHLIEIGMKQPPSTMLYLPYLSGERSPFSDPLARGAFIGIAKTTDKAALYRAVLEGVVYAYRHALDALLATPVTGLTMTGGGTRSQSWSHLFADVLGMPVAIAADAENVGVRGAVLAAAVENGIIDNYSPEGFVQFSNRMQPDVSHRDHYDRMYKIFLKGYPALQSIFHDLNL